MKCENCNYFRQLDDEYSAECLKFNLRTKYYNSSEWKCLKDGYKKAGWEMKTPFQKPITKIVTMCVNCHQRLDSDNYRKCPNCKKEGYIWQYPITYFKTKNGVKVVN